jgi:hypothetical protein
MNVKSIKKLVAEACIPLLKSRRALEVTEAARILLSICPGVVVTSGITNQTGKDSQAQADLNLARQKMAKQIEHVREIRKSANHRAYLRRKLKKAKEAVNCTAIETGLSKTGDQ